MLKKLTIPVVENQNKKENSPIINRITILIDSISFQFYSNNNSTYFDKQFDKYKVFKFTRMNLDQLSCSIDTLENEQQNISFTVNELQLYDLRNEKSLRLYNKMITSTLNDEKQSSSECESIKNDPQVKIDCAIPPAECAKVRIVINHPYFIIIPDFWSDLLPHILPLQNHLNKYNYLKQNTKDQGIKEETERKVNKNKSFKK